MAPCRCVYNLGLEIEEERDRQDNQWGGPGHDDKHDRRDWPTFIDKFILRADCDAEAGLFDNYEKNMIKVAALAIAAVKSSRRKRVPHGCIDTPGPDSSDR